jgi:hypothetical protein
MYRVDSVSICYMILALPHMSIRHMKLTRVCVLYVTRVCALYVTLRRCVPFRELLHPPPAKKKSIWVRAAADADETSSVSSGGGGGSAAAPSGASVGVSGSGGGSGGGSGSGGGGIGGGGGGATSGFFEARSSANAANGAIGGGGGLLLTGVLSAATLGAAASSGQTEPARMANPSALSYSLARPASCSLPRSSVSCMHPIVTAHSVCLVAQPCRNHHHHHHKRATFDP